MGDRAGPGLEVSAAPTGARNVRASCRKRSRRGRSRWDAGFQRRRSADNRSARRELASKNRWIYWPRSEIDNERILVETPTRRCRQRCENVKALGRADMRETYTSANEIGAGPSGIADGTARQGALKLGFRI